jgi:hypothetical protein
MPRTAKRLSIAAIQLPDGATATRVGDALEVNAPDGMLLVRYENGVLRIAPPKGDLELCAPHGRVVIQSALDVVVEAGRDASFAAARKLDLGAREATLRVGKLEVESKSAQLVSGTASVLARSITTSAESIATKCVKLETEATKIVERAKDVYRDVSGLAQSRLGRARTLVRDVFALESRRTTLRSKEDTAIDGEKILIG